MNITFSDITAIQYTTGEPKVLQTTHQDATLSIETGKKYKFTIKVDSTVEFHSLGFDLNWDEDNFTPVLLNGNVIFDDEPLFAEGVYDLVVNPFLDEKRLYITKALHLGQTVNSKGVFGVLSIHFEVTVVEDKLHLFIEIVEE